jgi:hypothetical protein
VALAPAVVSPVVSSLVAVVQAVPLPAVLSAAPSLVAVQPAVPALEVALPAVPLLAVALELLAPAVPAARSSAARLLPGLALVVLVLAPRTPRVGRVPVTSPVSTSTSDPRR